MSFEVNQSTAMLDSFSRIFIKLEISAAADSVLSSAKLCRLVVLMNIVRSFMKILNKIRPNTEP